MPTIIIIIVFSKKNKIKKPTKINFFAVLYQVKYVLSALRNLCPTRKIHTLIFFFLN